MNMDYEICFLNLTILNGGQGVHALEYRQIELDFRSGDVDAPSSGIYSQRCSSVA